MIILIRMDFSLHKLIKGLVKVWIYPEELYTQPLTSVITLTLIIFLLTSQQPLEVLIQKLAQGLLVVQWLRLYLPLQGVWVQSLVRELRFHMPGAQGTET